MKPTKESTVIAELIRQALDIMLYKLSDRSLNKAEILGVRSTTMERLRGQRVRGTLALTERKERNDPETRIP